ncbi:MAG: AAA domain-containing protein [Planctomycetota bacterium]
MKEYRIANPGLGDSALKKARERVLQVFRYLLELHRLRTPPALRIADREWTLPLDRLPATPHLQLGFHRDADGRIVGTGDSGCVLRARRPGELATCPEPSVVLKNWLKPGYDDPKADPEALLKKTVKVRGGGRQEFQDAEERVAAFEQWCDERAAWAEQALQQAQAFAVFSDLFDIHSRFERESEKYQLYLACGMLELEWEGQQVRHPLLLQRVELHFDPAAPEFRIVDSGDAPTLYTPLLRHLGLDGHVIQQFADAIATGRVHPLDGDGTDALFRDLVQRCWTDGQFGPKDTGGDGPAGGPRITRAPHLLLGNRSYGVEDNLERCLATLATHEDLPNSLLRIVGVDAAPKAAAGDADLLFTKPANPEQIEVLRRLQETGAVLVQGPPGTGKSHTIANLIGHLLAENKSILVTSHASKALRVVREKLPKELQPLCVSVLHSDDESARQLEESITGIVNKLASTSTKKLEKEIEKLQQQRGELAAECRALRQQLGAAVQEEYRELEVQGERLLPADAAARLAAGAGADDWIPAPVAPDAALPLDAVEVAQLYAALAELDDELAAMARADLPALDAFAAPADFAALLDEATALGKAGPPKAASGPWATADGDAAALAPAARGLQQAVEPLREAEPWYLAAVTAGCAGAAERDAWLGLCAQIEDGAAELAELAPLVVDHRPDVGRAPQLAAMAAACRRAAEHLDGGGSLEDLLGEDGPLVVLADARVDGELPTTAPQFWALLAAVEMRGRRETLGRSWDLKMAAHGRGWSTLGAAPEVLAQELLAELRAAACWHDEVWTPAMQALLDQGLDLTRLLRSLGQSARAAPTPASLLALVDTALPPVLQQRENELRLGSGARRRDQMLALLDGVPRKGPCRGSRSGSAPASERATTTPMPTPGTSWSGCTTRVSASAPPTRCWRDSSRWPRPGPRPCANGGRRTPPARRRGTRRGPGGTASGRTACSSRPRSTSASCSSGSTRRPRRCSSAPRATSRSRRGWRSCAAPASSSSRRLPAGCSCRRRSARAPASTCRCSRRRRGARSRGAVRRCRCGSCRCRGWSSRSTWRRRASTW